jgi:hypothetical protein
VVSEQFSFYGVRLLASRPTPPTWRAIISLFVWLVPLDLSGMFDPTSSYATAGIALWISGALKPHHHDKVKTPFVGLVPFYPLQIMHWYVFVICSPSDGDRLNIMMLFTT